MHIDELIYPRHKDVIQMGFEWLALAAAFLWAIASLMSVKPAQHLGSFAYSRWRMGCTAIILSSMAWFTGGWSTVEANLVTPMSH